MKQKLLSLLLMAFIPMAMMAYDCEVNGIYYNVIEKAKTASVVRASYYNTEYHGDIVIPETFEYEGITYTVTSIENEALTKELVWDRPEFETITSITIPNTVTSIGSQAFRCCKSLTSIDIPNSVTSIGDMAFASCNGLTSINIGDGLSSLASNAFSGCPSLASITVSSNNNNYDSRNNCNAIIETVSNTLVLGCKNTVIPNSVTSIGNAAFSGCSGLTSIDIPNSVTSIGSGAFSDCSGLTSIDIPNSVTRISNSAFSLCTSLTSITIPGSISVISSQVFYRCSGLTSVTISEGVTSIGDQAFIKCSSLTSIVIPNSVTNIDSWAFSDCSSLTSVTIGNSVTSIGAAAFINCKSLISIDIPNSVTSIGSSAFEGCSKLSSVTIGNSVTRIDGTAFKNCKNIEVVTCNTTTVPSTNTNAFDGSYTEYATLIVPDASLSAYQSTAPWSNFGTILPMSQAAVVTANSYTREYGDPNPTFEYTCATTLNGTPTITCTADATSAPGTYPITISQGTVTNTGLFFVNGTLTVTKAPVTITANSYTIREGDALPTFDATYTGLKNNETETVLSPVISCAAADGNTPGTYDINVTATSDNYNITVVKGTLTILPTKMQITISSAGMATYCSAYDLDFSGITDFKACIATGYNRTTGNVIMQPVKDAPAGTGLYLQGTPGTYDVPCDESGSYYVNLLVGTTAPTTISPVVDGFKNLILYNGNNGVGFYTIANDYTVGANKAYLQLPATLLGGSAGANRVGVEFEENLDGIENIDMSVTSGAVWYSLDGRQLNGKPTQKGIYVVNGRKVVIK